MTTDDNDEFALLPASALAPPAPRPNGASTRPLPPPAPLFYVDGATEGTLQWKAETFQLVNWGGFEGRVRFDLGVDPFG